MLDALFRTAREQFTARHVLGIVLVFAGFEIVLDASSELLVGLAIAFLVVEVVTVFQNTPELDQRYVQVTIGALGVLGSVVLGAVALRGAGVLWLPVLVGVFAAWLAVDAAADLYRGREPPRSGRTGLSSSSDVLLVVTHAHLVTSELEDGPRTTAELADRCDLTESRVEQALEHLVDSGVVSCDGDRYVLEESETGIVAFVRRIVGGAVARALRPLRS